MEQEAPKRERNCETISTKVYKYGFIRIQPIREYFDNGRYVSKREQPHLVNTAYIVDVILGRKVCVIRMVDGTTMTVDKEELMEQLRLLLL